MAGNGVGNVVTLLRYHSNGSLDSTFDADGIAMAAPGLYAETASALVLQNDGKIVMAGFAINGMNADFYVLRFNNDLGTGIRTFAEQTIDVTIYPNPSNGKFTILLPTANAEITVTDLHGRQIIKMQTTEMTTNFQLDNPGVYFVSVSTKEGTTTRKLILN